MPLSLTQIVPAEPGCRGVCDWLMAGARHVLERLLEAEVTEALGRPSYGRGGATAPAASDRIYRNGYKVRNVRTADGKCSVALPQVRNAAGPYQSCLWKTLRGSCPAVHGLVLRLYEAGLDTRDLTAFLRCLGDDDCEELLSRRALRQVVDELHQEHSHFRTRDLTRLRPVALSIGSLRARGTDGSTADWCVVWSRCLDESLQVLDVFRPGNDDACQLGDCLAGLHARRLPPPLGLGCSGCPRIRKAVEAHWSESERRKFWRDELFEQKRLVPASLSAYVRDAAQSLTF